MVCYQQGFLSQAQLEENVADFPGLWKAARASGGSWFTLLSPVSGMCQPYSRETRLKVSDLKRKKIVLGLSFHLTDGKKQWKCK